ncbi:MAG: 3-dehydroquinate dehydratase [Clostridia bacterium]|nr:3-dehydroquinate dehydratase [Clostridia bacterium]
MKLYVLNGPNLNLLGLREPTLYGKESYEDLLTLLEKTAKELGVELVVRQSNHEGDLVDWIAEAYFQNADGIVINPGAYSHTSIALYDAILSVGIPTAEVHLTNPDEREDFRKIDYVGKVAKYRICGKGQQGYAEAIKLLVKDHENKD